MPGRRATGESSQTEWHGTNVLYRDGDRVFRTCFINSRGDEQMGSTGAAPDKKWVEASDAGEAAFPNQGASTKP